VAASLLPAVDSRHGPPPDDRRTGIDVRRVGISLRPGRTRAGRAGPQPVAEGGGRRFRGGGGSDARCSTGPPTKGCERASDETTGADPAADDESAFSVETRRALLAAVAVCRELRSG